MQIGKRISALQQAAQDRHVASHAVLRFKNVPHYRQLQINERGNFFPLAVGTIALMVGALTLAFEVRMITGRSLPLGRKLGHQGGNALLKGGHGRLLTIRPARRRLRLVVDFREVDRDARPALVIENPWQVQPASKRTRGVRAHPQPVADFRIGETFRYHGRGRLLIGRAMRVYYSAGRALITCARPG